MDTHRIVCIGGSAGSLDPILSLFGNLPSDLDATFFVVQHVSPDSPQYLAELISRAGVFPAE